jgi:hypothetical protein
MIELTLIACMLSDVKHCKSVIIELEPGVSVYGCVVKGQQQAAEYASNNPGWIITKYKCARARRFARGN